MVYLKPPFLSGSNMTLAIDAENIVKRFPVTNSYRDIVAFWKRSTVEVLKGVDLQIPAGEATALLGPNGAGKTTLLKILAGLILTDEGYIEINGRDVTDGSSTLGGNLIYITNEERSMFWRLSAAENLKVFATLQHIGRAEQAKLIPELIELLGLTEYGDRPVMRYSSGMKQRLAIARGLLTKPNILLLDEPTRSLDPAGARQLWDFIRTELIGELGTTLLLATHNTEEAAYLCNKVAILHRGELRAHNTVSQVISELSGKERWVIRTTSRLNGSTADIGALPGIYEVSEVADANSDSGFALELELDQSNDRIPMVVQHLVNSGIGVAGIDKEQVSLGMAIEQLSRVEN